MYQLQVRLKWTDPPDISTTEPITCEWSGTVVVRKEGSAPLHRWDGTLIVDSTTRNEYSSDALIDTDVVSGKTYYYGIFPYHVELDEDNNLIKYYRYTKVVSITTEEYIPKAFVDQVVITKSGGDLLEFENEVVITKITS